MESAFKDIQFELRDGVGRIVLNRPPVNILNIAMMEEIQAALRQAQATPATRAIVFSAAGRMFSAGVDIAEHTHELMERMLTTFHEIFRLLADGEIPTVAVVQGHALGGGCELACFCDLVIAAQGVKFGQPEIAVGVFPPVAAALFPHLIGGRKAAELVLTGEAIPAEEAQRIGLINAVVPSDQLVTEADRLLGRLTDKSAAVLRIAKRALRAGMAAGFDEALPRIETIYVKALMSLQDPEEGLKAFMEKRKAVWKHR
ncbi:MAG: enoyl-CoA hydratase/isomerase family protein [Candidatus Methylomirabilota bacterium]